MGLALPLPAIPRPATPPVAARPDLVRWRSRARRGRCNHSVRFDSRPSTSVDTALVRHEGAVVEPRLQADHPGHGPRQRPGHGAQARQAGQAIHLAGPAGGEPPHSTAQHEHGGRQQAEQRAAQAEEGLERARLETHRVELVRDGTCNTQGNEAVSQAACSDAAPAKRPARAARRVAYPPIRGRSTHGARGARRDLPRRPPLVGPRSSAALSATALRI